MNTREAIGLGIVLVALAFAAGRFSKPERVVERTVEIESTRERASEVAHESVAASEQVATHKEAETTFHPDGRVVVREVVDSAAVREVVREVEVVRTVEVERVVIQERERLVESSRPAWRVALDLGVADAPHRVDVPGIPRYLPAIATLTAERRIAGPVWVGAWASSTPGAGLRVAVEF